MATIGTVSSGIETRIGRETTFGTPPTGAAAYRVRRVFSHDKTDNVDRRPSRTIRRDGQIADTVDVTNDGTGTLNGPFAYQEWDDELQQVLQAEDWRTTTPALPAMVAVDTGGFTAASGGVPASVAVASELNYRAGHVVTTVGAADEANNGTAVVVGTAPGLLYLQGLPFVTDSTVQGNVTPLEFITNGKTQSSSAMEVEDTDAPSTHIERYPAMAMQSMRINVAGEEQIEVEVPFIAQPPGDIKSASSGSAPTAILTSEELVLENVLFVREGVPQFGNIATSASEWDRTGFKMMGIELNINPNPKARPADGGPGPQVLQGNGVTDVTGRVMFYYNTAPGETDEALYNKLSTGKISGLFFVVAGADGLGYAIQIPRLRYTSVNINPAGSDTDVIAECSFQALADPDLAAAFETNVTGGTILIARGTIAA